MKTLTLMIMLAASLVASAALAAEVAVGECVLDLEAERPGAGDSAATWRRWWIDTVGVHDGAVLDEAAPGESLWMVLIQCGRSWYARGVRFDDETPVVEVESRLSVEECCSAEGIVPESVERLTVGGRAFPGFEIRGQAREEDEVSTVYGETSIYYFPGREVEVVDAPLAEDLRAEMTMNGHRYTVDYGSVSATTRYNVPVGAGFVTVSRDVELRNEKSLTLVEDELQSIPSYFCRSVEGSVRVGAADEDFDLLVRQEIVAPVGPEACVEYYRGSPEAEGIEPRVVGYIERRLRITDERVIVDTRQELNEFVDLL